MDCCVTIFSFDAHHALHLIQRWLINLRETGCESRHLPSIPTSHLPPALTLKMKPDTAFLTLVVALAVRINAAPVTGEVTRIASKCHAHDLLGDHSLSKAASEPTEGYEPFACCFATGDH